MTSTTRKNEHGMTLPLVAVFIVVLFVMAALAIDLGIAYTARTSAQHAADAAALAGAWTFMTPGVPQPASAVNAAILVAAQTKILGQAVAITAANVTVRLPDPVAGVPAWVTVTVPRTGNNAVGTFFARAIGWNSINVSAKATAEAGVAGTSTACLKPLFVPNTIVNTAPPNVNPCNSPQQTLFDNNGNVTPYAWQLLNSPTRQLYTIRPTSPKGALVPSQYFSVDYGSGASTYRCTLSGCLNQCGVSNPQQFCASTLTTETGNMVGPTISGINGLMGTPPTYRWQGLGDYLDTQTNQSVDIAPNVVVTPVWNNCTSTIKSGVQTFAVAGFAELFISNVDGGGNVEAYLLNASPCAASGGSDGGGGSGQASGPLGVPIRLIQPQ
jgi:hypothetical protein